MSLLAGLAPAERKLARRAGTPQWAEPMLATFYAQACAKGWEGLRDDKNPREVTREVTP